MVFLAPNIIFLTKIFLTRKFSDNFSIAQNLRKRGNCQLPSLSYPLPGHDDTGIRNFLEYALYIYILLTYLRVLCVQLYVGFICNLITFPINFLIAFLFKRSRPRRKRASRVEEALRRMRQKQ